MFDVSGITGLTQDSRAVKDGYLFAAFSGVKSDGRQFIAAAIRNGARVILAQTGTILPEDVDTSHVRLIESDNPRQDFAKMAARFYGAQPDEIAAVTGTNGKTSVADFMRQLWDARGYKAASIGTLGVQGGARADNAVRSGSMTTPDSVALHATLADLAAAGVTHLAMEASSHGLDQYRLDGVRVKAAGFTNLSRDHLDYHADMQSYFQAKIRLFSEIVDKDGISVLNADVAEYDAISSASRALVLSYGFAGKDIVLKSLLPTPHGQSLVLDVFGRPRAFVLPLVGQFQAMNALCAFGLVCGRDGANMDADAYLGALENLKGVPGRLEVFALPSCQAAVYVDYAHTPDALETVLKALRPHTRGRLICVFGCGGDRDAGKRPMMGALAASLADVVIVTDDNPRTENADAIRGAILQGAVGGVNIGGRRKAIEEAVGMLKDGDVLLVAGKGHEQGQIFADYTEAFDDRDEVKKAISALNLNKGA